MERTFKILYWKNPEPQVSENMFPFIYELGEGAYDIGTAELPHVFKKETTMEDIVKSIPSLEVDNLKLVTMKMTEV